MGSLVKGLMPCRAFVAGFFAYLLLFFALTGRHQTADVMGDGDAPVKIPG